MSTYTEVLNGWITDEHGNKFHYKDNDLHNEGGPAIIHNNGTKVWYFNGEAHREDGPAIIYSNGTKMWFVNNKIYSFEDYCKELNLSQEQIVKLTIKYDL